MNITNVNARRERIIDVENSAALSIDTYIVDAKTPMSSQEFTLYVNRYEHSVEGEAVRYGSWEELDEEEALDIIGKLQERGELLEDYAWLVTLDMHGEELNEEEL